MIDLGFWHDITFWRTAGIIFAAIGQTLFTVLYFTFPWYANFLGRALFFKAVAFMTLVDVAVAGRIWDWPYEDNIFVLLYWVLGLGIWYQFIAFLRVRLNNRQDAVSGNPHAVAEERARAEAEPPPTHRSVDA
jgi:hypothetical protein